MPECWNCGEETEDDPEHRTIATVDGDFKQVVLCAECTERYDGEQEEEW